MNQKITLDSSVRISTITTDFNKFLSDLTKTIYEVVYSAKTDYTFKKFVVSILSKHQNKKLSDLDKAIILLDWFQKNIRPYYQPDPTFNEGVKSPLLMLKEFLEGSAPYGDCDDFVAFYNAMLETIGIPTTVIYVFYRPHADAKSSSDKPNHIICAFMDRKTGKWYVADPTSPFPVMSIYEYHDKVAEIKVIVHRKINNSFDLKPDNWD